MDIVVGQTFGNVKYLCFTLPSEHGVQYYREIHFTDCIHVMLSLIMLLVVIYLDFDARDYLQLIYSVRR
jgi:hypothetical protein